LKTEPTLKTCFFIPVLWFATLFCHQVLAQTGIFKTYSVQDGLVANPVRCIFQDAKGFIWIATWEGLSKYDGYKFTNFTTASGLSHNLVNDLFERDDKLYVAENNGAVDVIVNDRILKAFQAPSAVNRFIPIKKDVALLTTDDDGVYEFRAKRFYRPSQKFGRYPIDRLLPLNDSLIIGHSGEQTVHAFTKDYNPISIIQFDGMSFGRLYTDSQKRTWLCTSQGLKLLSTAIEKDRPLEFLPLPPLFNIHFLRDGIVVDILEDRDGSFWIATYNGLMWLEPSGRYQVYTESNGLPSKIITTIFRDREQNIWIGTALGLAKYSGKSNIRSLVHDISSIYPLKKDQWLMCNFGRLQRYQNSINRSLNLVSINSNLSPAIVKGSSPILFYYHGNVGMLNEKGSKVIWQKKWQDLHPLEYSSCTDSEGTSFMGNSDGIAVLLKNHWYVDKTLPYRITSLAIDQQGFLWVGTWNNGLYRVRYASNGTQLSFSATDLTPLIKSKQIRSLFCDSRGNTWVGTRYHGAYCLTPRGKDQYSIQNFEKPQGLISNFITAFAESPNGEIWVGSYLGLDKLVREQNSYRVLNFGTVINLFGLVSAITPAGDNWYCIARSTLFQFKDIGLEHEPPYPTELLAVSIASTQNKDSLVDKTTPITLPYTQNSVRFRFSALSFLNEKQILYSYRLKGSVDTSWSQPQNTHEVTYASLSPGRYSFEVRTLGGDGRSGSPAVFSFTIRPPFWKTWWFYLLCLIGLASLLFGLYRYRINQLLKWQKARDRIATDLHDDIGSTLSSIQILSQLSQGHLHQPEKAEGFLKRISEEVGQSSQAMDDIIWSVNSRNDTVVETLARMRRYAADLFDNSSITCHLQLDETSESQKMGMEQRRDVFLIYKEALNNILKHAAAQNAWITVWQTHQSFRMIIKDDGRGFQPDTPTDRNGMKNLQTRVERWKGTIRVDSAPGKGTSIEMNIPVYDFKF
jgi:signal transduction histidine kinase/ligand-binding sensor domain-containing protein